MRKFWLSAAAMPFAAGLIHFVVPTAQASHVDMSGCADSLSELNAVLEYLPPPPPMYVPPVTPNIDVSAHVGRRFSASGCI